MGENRGEGLLHFVVLFLLGVVSGCLDGDHQGDGGYEYDRQYQDDESELR